MLNWINSKKVLGTFVDNRVKEIKADKDLSSTIFQQQKTQQIQQVTEHLPVNLEMIECGGMAMIG